MSLSVFVPTEPVFAPLVARAEEVCQEYGYTLQRGSQQESAAALLNNIADVALVSPLGYGLGVGKADFRIVPATLLALRGYTRFASAYLRNGAAELKTIASSTPDSFMAMIGSIVMSEKFDLALSWVDVLKEPDILLEYGYSEANPTSLDLSDEWYDVFESDLPLAIWAARPDNLPENIAGIVSAMAAPALPHHRHVHEEEGMYSAEREGVIHWHWYDEVEPALDEILKLFYYHRQFVSIPAIKILGRDAVE